MEENLIIQARLVEKRRLEMELKNKQRMKRMELEKQLQRRRAQKKREEKAKMIQEIRIKNEKILKLRKEEFKAKELEGEKRLIIFKNLREEQRVLQ